MRRSPLAVLLALTVSSSGCVLNVVLEADEPFSVDVPSFELGDSWTTSNQYATHTGGRSQEAQSVVSHRVERDLSMVPDRFGRPVEALLIRHHTDSRSHAPGSGPVNWKMSPDSESAIETAGGNWLRLATGLQRLTMATSIPGCRVDITDTVPMYMTEPTPYDQGSLMGRSLAVGETVRLEWDAVREDHVYQYAVSYEGLRKEDVALRIGGADSTVPAVVAKVTYTSQRTHDAKAAPESDHKITTTSWFVDGVPLPVRTVSHFEVEHEVEFDSESRITDFAHGRGALPIRHVPLEAQFDGPHPDAVLTPFATHPNLDGLRFRFPFEAALAAIATDPRAAELRLWRERHPDHGLRARSEAAVRPPPRRRRLGPAGLRVGDGPTGLERGAEGRQGPPRRRRRDRAQGRKRLPSSSRRVELLRLGRAAQPVRRHLRKGRAARVRGRPRRAVLPPDGPAHVDRRRVGRLHEGHRRRDRRPRTRLRGRYGLLGFGGA
ncbi:MAG: hypothetical protein HYT80_07715 [Euryarchaeota archaeon]|nr:hypothetical protein [Euryarchaeota archaeon]